jgi:predicted transposase YdaD
MLATTVKQWEQDLVQQGLQQGLQKGMSIHEIAELTGLSFDEVKKL